MSFHQPPVQPPFPGQPPMPPGPQQPGPKWARKRILVPAAVLTLFVGIGMGAAGSDGTETASADAKPGPTVTVTETAAAAEPAKGESKPAPTVTVTKTVKPKAEKPKAEKPKQDAEPAEEAPAGQVVFKVWGSAPAGVDINYGSDNDSRSGKGLPFEKTLQLSDDALYYNVYAQLMGGGDINCSVTVNGETKKAHASGDYNICTAQMNGGLLGGWD
ncbi:MmpS family transport accessory protein [Streptomyces sp. NPDC015242]|uniref:MmpS family transport accessory protein n=1 Tax=Streptomyces sp. NPDC015242 TaxID=3364951 RepID=UPI0036F79EC2